MALVGRWEVVAVLIRVLEAVSWSGIRPSSGAVSRDKHLCLSLAGWLRQQAVFPSRPHPCPRSHPRLRLRPRLAHADVPLPLSIRRSCLSSRRSCPTPPRGSPRSGRPPPSSHSWRGTAAPPPACWPSTRCSCRTRGPRCSSTTLAVRDGRQIWERGGDLLHQRYGRGADLEPSAQERKGKARSVSG